MSLTNDIALLGKLPLFSEFSPEQLRLLAFSAESRTYSAGDILFWEGDASDFGCVVVSGRIDLQCRRKDSTVTVGSAGTGDLVGELCLITDIERPATAVAVGPTEVIRIPRALFQRILSEYPDMAARIQAQLVQRLSHVNTIFKSLGDTL